MMNEVVDVGAGTPLEKKSSLEEIRARFDQDVERFSNEETGQRATIDAPLVLELVGKSCAGHLKGGGHLLDLGCGAGNFTLRVLREIGPLHCHLVDLSQPMLARARARVEKANAASVTIYQSDLSAGSCGERFRRHSGSKSICRGERRFDLAGRRRRMGVMIRGVIFDLDSCLAAADEVGKDLFEPAFEAIRAASKGEVAEARLEAAFADCWRFPFDWVASRHQFSEAMRAAGFAAFRQIEVRQPMRGYGDLAALAEIPAKFFLVTSGFRRLQESKIKALGIGPLFSGIHIDAIDGARPQGKLAAFEEILKANGFSRAEVLVVGDNPDSEIAAGNGLGMTTIQILRPGVPVSEAATHRIRNLTELKFFL